MKTAEKITCHLCGKEQELYFWDTLNDILKLTGLCHTCHFWIHLAYKLYNTSNHDVLVDQDYNILWPTKYEGKLSNSSKGFGGSWMKGVWDDGYTLVHDNWWTNGDVPKHLRYLFKPNGKSVWLSTEEAYAEINGQTYTKPEEEEFDDLPF